MSSVPLALQERSPQDRDVQQREEMPEAGGGVDGILRHAVPEENDHGGALQGLEQCRHAAPRREIRASARRRNNARDQNGIHDGLRAGVLHGRPAS